MHHSSISISAGFTYYYPGFLRKNFVLHSSGCQSKSLADIIRMLVFMKLSKLISILLANLTVQRLLMQHSWLITFLLLYFLRNLFI
jgi:hypothetical protein